MVYSSIVSQLYSCSKQNYSFTEVVYLFLLLPPSDMAVQAVGGSLFSYYVSDFLICLCAIFLLPPYMDIEEK